MRRNNVLGAQTHTHKTVYVMLLVIRTKAEKRSLGAVVCHMQQMKSDKLGVATLCVSQHTHILCVRGTWFGEKETRCARRTKRVPLPTSR